MDQAAARDAAADYAEMQTREAVRMEAPAEAKVVEKAVVRTARND